MRKAALLPALAPLLVAATPLTKPVATPPEQETEHKVQPGETLHGIASHAAVPRVLIIEANGLTPPYSLRAGQTLKIPRTRRYTVVRGDTGFSVAYRHGVPWRDVAVANGLDPDKPLRAGQELLIPTLITVPDATPAAASTTTPTVSFAWPVAGPVRRSFTARGSSGSHDGIDIRAAEGTAVRAAAAGKVLFAGPEARQFGNLVVVDHGGGWVSAYAFLSRITVAKDEEVSAGERLGLVGQTGLAKGPELHFELRRNNRTVDPAKELPGKGMAPKGLAPKGLAEAK